MRYIYSFIVVFIFSLTGLNAQPPGKDTKSTIVHYPEEKYFKSVRQLTEGGDNAEAYFSFDDQMITFQVTNPKWNAHCDQIFYSSLKDIKPVMVSTGKGRTTCSYFMPGDSLILYASTHEASDECPPKPPPREDHKYVWPIYDSFDIYVSDLEGKIRTKLTDSPGYDAEATLSPQGDKIVFTSIRSGDLELYTMNTDGSDVKQITFELGYDGGAFFSPDGKRLIFRSSRPKTDEEITVYNELLSKGMVMPTDMELFTCNVDGSELRQITKLGGANWAPYFSPDGNKVIFSSNHKKRGYNFNLYMIDLEGGNLEQISFDPVFDAFPVFSRDGKRLIFSSNRNNKGGRDTNLFIAEWK